MLDQKENYSDFTRFLARVSTRAYWLSAHCIHLVINIFSAWNVLTLRRDTQILTSNMI